MCFIYKKNGANFGDFCCDSFQMYMGRLDTTETNASSHAQLSWLATGQMGQHANERNFDIAMQHLQAALGRRISV